MIEGYLTNGSFSYRNSRGYYYDASYISHAHGWSSGPTSALTNFILGLTVTGRAGSAWSLKPQFASNLTNVEGGFTTILGKYQAGWNLTAAGDGYSLSWSTPNGTDGTVVLPLLPNGKDGTLTLDGQTYEGKTLSANETLSLSIAGGAHVVQVQAK